MMTQLSYKESCVMSEYLLDTCFILGLFKGNKTALALMQNTPPQNCYVSVINRIELLGYHSITPSDEQILTDFLNEMVCLPPSPAVEQKAIAIRKHHKIKLADSVVLATALVNRLELLTLDNSLNNKFIQEK